MFSTLLFMLATAASQTAAPVERAAVDERVLGKGTPFETPWFERRGSAEGPTVLITGGMHGNEPAGAAAAEEIACWTIGKGKLVVVPRMNRPALAAKQRLIPDTSEPEGNVNRHFPIGGEVTPGVATDLWALFEAVEPDWVLDLHEGFAFRRLNSGSVGSSVIACADERAGELAQQMIAAVDGTIDAAERKFTLIRGPIAGSFARAAWENAGVPSMILETTFGLFPVAEDEERRFSVSSRARQHRLMVHTFLSEIGMEPCSADVLVGAREEESRVRVAIYDDLGAGVSGSAAMERVLAAYEDVVTRRVGSADVCAGALAQFDVVLHPGGSGKAQARSLGEVGRAQEIEFVRAGGGFLGVCAGGYLAACNYDWSLGVLDARTIDTASGHWRRGRAELEIELSPAGMSLFDEVDASVDIQYANGPIFAPGEREEIPDYEVLALYRGEVALNGTSTGIMPGTPACIRGAFGNGRAIAFSPHPEKSPALEHFVRDAVLWAAGECDRTVSDTNQSVSPELRAAGAERR
jgi:glutamine amidotransferase-like uncharacterized protein